MKHRKVIENGKLLSGHVPYVGASDNDKIAQVNNGEWSKGTGSSGLPSVSAADNGKLLGVTDGAWGKVDAPSGGGTEIFDIAFTGTWNEQDEFIITATKTGNEILAAQEAGKYITANYKATDDAQVTRAIAITVSRYNNTDVPSCTFLFLNLYNMGSGYASPDDLMEFLKIKWDHVNNSWYSETLDYSLTPYAP